MPTIRSLKTTITALQHHDSYRENSPNCRPTRAHINDRASLVSKSQHNRDASTTLLQSMSITRHISVLALSLVILPSCQTDDEPSSHETDTPADSDSSNDAGTKPQGNSDGGTKPNGDTSDDTEADEQAGSDGGATDPDEGNTSDSDTSDTEDDSDTGEDTNDAPNADADAGAGENTDDPPEESEELETTSFFMPTVEPDNTVSPRIRIDENGGVHSVYAAYAGGGAYYSYCAGECENRDNFDVVYFPTDGTVANAMLALTADGKPRVLLSGFTDATYATCDEDCTDIDNWTSGVILEHGGDQEITGDAMALDPDGNPHFMSHSYRAFAGIGQKDPFTYHATCSSGTCTQASDWTVSQIGTQIWEEGRMQFDANGALHLAFVAVLMEDKSITNRIAAYSRCDGDCGNPDAWPATGLANAYVDDLEAISLHSSISMDLTRDGLPRVVMLGKADDGTKQLIYFECDENCTSDGFHGMVLSTYEYINDGMALELDANDHPRFVHTLNYNIFLAACDDLPCNGEESEWSLHAVETSGDIPVDDIILYPNCSVAAWFLHTPAMALDNEGNPFVGYQARDISGGVHNADPTKPDCVAGTDMTLTRMTQMVWE